MIEVKPLSDFSFAVSEFNRDAIAKALKDVLEMPRLHKIVIHNKTKSVMVKTSMTPDSTLHITVTNPKDEEFDVQED